MAFAPILTRLYGPETFGLLGTFMAVLAVLTPIAALTYPVAMVLAASDQEAKKLGRISISVACFISTIFALIQLLAGDWLAKTLSLEAVAAYLWLIPVAMLSAAIQQIFTQWLIRKKQFYITARIAVIQALLVNSAKAGAGVFHPIGATLIVIASIGQAVHGLMLWLGIRNSNGTASHSDEQVIAWPELALRYQDFPLYRTPQILINAMSINAPIIFLAALVGPAAAGFFSITRSVLALPATLMSNSVKDVLYPKAVEARSNGQSMSSLLIKATVGLSVLGLPPLVMITVFGPTLFGFVFGDSWEISGHYARWLAIFMYFNLVNAPSVSIVPVLQLERWALWHSILSAVMRISGLVLGFYIFGDGIGAIAVFSILGAACYIYLILKVWLVTKIND